MRASPGGHTAPADVVGRGTLIDELWTVLENQSLLLTAERRIGKTTVIQKMVAEASAATLPIYSDVESVHS